MPTYGDQPIVMMITVRKAYVFDARFPSQVAATLCLLRRRLRLSREVSDDVVRARGVFRAARHDFDMNVFDGGQHDVVRVYYSDGTLYAETTYVDGEKHGIERFWYRNGALSTKTMYINGKQHGKALYWDENGNAPLAMRLVSSVCREN